MSYFVPPVFWGAYFSYVTPCFVEVEELLALEPQLATSAEAALLVLLGEEISCGVLSM